MNNVISPANSIFGFTSIGIAESASVFTGFAFVKTIRVNKEIIALVFRLFFPIIINREISFGLV